MNSDNKNIITKLVVSNKDQGVRIYELKDGENLGVGRESSNEIVIQDLRVSRVHASFFNRGLKIFVTDLFSRNGTLVNGEPVIGDRELQDQDVVNLGATVITVEREPTAPHKESDEVTATGGFTTTKIAAAMFRSDEPFTQLAIERLQEVVLAHDGHNIFQEPRWALSWWHGKSLTKMASATVKASHEILTLLRLEIPSLSIVVFPLSALLEGEEEESWKINLMGDPLKICEEYYEILTGFTKSVLAEKAIVKRVSPEWKFELVANFRHKHKDNSTPIELYSLIADNK